MEPVLDNAVPTTGVGATRHTPLVIAHRGSSLAEPEHTLKAYLRAIDEGADALECDVRL
ncbi:MAG TPA: glycerophosphodiester phosphodiesterase family protein, partial [Pedococcus sp.]|nr:glycerophosphodiester phosphodiesterase family protein [Pedococcus sp.]